MINAFYFMLKVLFVLKMFTILSCLHGYADKPLNRKVKFNFKIYDVTDWKHILLNISRSKGNQTIKFGQLKLYKESFKSHGENETRRLVPDLFLFFKNALYKVKAKGRHLCFDMIGGPRLGHTIKTNFITFRTVDPKI